MQGVTLATSCTPMNATKRTPEPHPVPLRKRIRRTVFASPGDGNAPDVPRASVGAHDEPISSLGEHGQRPPNPAVQLIIQKKMKRDQDADPVRDVPVGAPMHVVQRISTSRVSSDDAAATDDDDSKFETNVPQTFSTRPLRHSDHPNRNPATTLNSHNAPGGNGSSSTVRAYGGNRLSFSRFVGRVAHPQSAPAPAEPKLENLAATSSNVPASRVVQVSPAAPAPTVAFNALFGRVEHLGTLRRRRRPVITPPERGGFAPTSWPKPRPGSSSNGAAGSVPVPAATVRPMEVHADQPPNASRDPPFATRILVRPTNDEGTFPCEVCNMVFNKYHALSKHHRAVHLNARPHVCTYCNRRFGEKHNLSTHVRTVHLKERNHICPHCQRGFGAKPDLQKHIRSVHLKERPFSCEHCDKKFGSRPEVRKHISTVHLKQKPHKCPQCSKSFGLKHHLTVHLRRVHLHRVHLVPPEKDFDNDAASDTASTVMPASAFDFLTASNNTPK